MLSIVDIAPLIRDPVSRDQVVLEDGAFIVPATGIRYCREGNFVDFVGNEETKSSQEHYEVFPFDTVDWTDRESRLLSVEAELREFIPTLPVESIGFDVGCGPGRITVALHEAGCNVIAVDLSRVALDMLAQHVDVPRLRANGLNLPLFDNIADWVISTGVVHHTPDPRQAIAELCRILKPGGRLYLRLLNRYGYYAFMYGVLGGAMRALRRSGVAGRCFVNGVARPIYKLVRGRVGGGPVPKDKLDALFENYFMKDTVTLVTKAEVDSCLATAGMKVQTYSVRSAMHCYVAEKLGE